MSQGKKTLFEVSHNSVFLQVLCFNERTKKKTNEYLFFVFEKIILHPVSQNVFRKDLALAKGKKKGLEAISQMKRFNNLRDKTFSRRMRRYEWKGNF